MREIKGLAGSNRSEGSAGAGKSAGAESNETRDTRTKEDKNMGRASIKENKSIYQIAREEAGLTRAEASEKLGFISESRLEKIESGKTGIHPEEVLAMSKAYEAPAFCNSYCANECPIGKEFIPEIKVKDLSTITLEMLNTINRLNNEKERLVEITVDGEISEDELADFNRIKADLEEMSMSLDSLKLWLEGRIGKSK